MRKALIISILLMVATLAFGQESNWTNFTSNGVINTLVNGGNCLWIGTTEGLISYDKTTGGKIKYTTYNSGLVNNKVNTIFVDSLGDKWIATDTGVSRFDGTNWQTYTSENSSISGYVYCINGDMAGNIWFGTAQSLTKFDGTNWTSYSPIEDPYLNVRSITFGGQGDIWVCCSHRGLFKFDGTNWTQYNTIYGNPLYTNHIITVPSGVMWLDVSLTYENYTLGSYNGITWTIYNNLGFGSLRNKINAIVYEPNGKVWIGTNYGLISYDGENWTSYMTSNSGLHDNNVPAICLDDDNTLWITDGKDNLQSYNGSNWRSDSISDTMLPDNVVTSLLKDNQDTIWIGTLNGICSFDGAVWTGFNDGNSTISNKHITVITEDNYDNKWVAYDNHSIVKYNQTGWTDYSAGLFAEPGTTVNSLAFDLRNVLWIGSSGGLLNCNWVEWNLYNTSSSQIPGNNLSGVSVDSSGIVWMYINNVGLVKYDGVSWTVFNEENSELLYRNISCIMIDSEDNIWVCCYGYNPETDYADYCLLRYDRTSWIVFDADLGDIPIDDVTCMAEDNLGNFWFGTHQGLMKFNWLGWTLYDEENSHLPNNDITALACDNANKIWVGTNGNGLGVFDYQSTLSEDNYECKTPALTIAPNPIRDNTHISFELEKSGQTEISIYNLKGQKVITLASATLSKGKHDYNWNLKDAKGNKVSSGVYLVKIISGGKGRTSKCLVLK